MYKRQAQVYGFAIKDDMVLTGLYFAHTESCAFLMRIGLALYTGSQLTVQRIKIGMELIPQMEDVYKRQWQQLYMQLLRSGISVSVRSVSLQVLQSA